MDALIYLKLSLGVNPGCHFWLLVGFFVSLIWYNILHAFFYSRMFDLITGSLRVLSVLVSQSFRGRSNEAILGLTTHMECWAIT